jgi:hypothetical protein
MNKLKMYVWESRALRDYSMGEIIVSAFHLEEAKLKVREFAKKNIPFGTNEESFLKTIEKDLESDPYIKEDTVHFIEGESPSFDY